MRAASRDATISNPSSTATSARRLYPDFGIVEGAFQLSSIEYAGSHNGEATYDLSLASAGALTFTAI